MPERPVFWSDEALDQVDLIKEYIRVHWREKEMKTFLKLLKEFEALVKRYPNGYQRSEKYPNCRRAVIHPNVSVIYRVLDKEIEVVTVYDNRSARS